MNTDDIATVLNSVDMFAGLSPRVLKRLADAGRVVEAPPGAEIVSAGESVSGFRAFSPEGVEMHVILTGTATVRVNGQVVGIAHRRRLLRGAGPHRRAAAIGRRGRR